MEISKKIKLAAMGVAATASTALFEIQSASAITCPTGTTENNGTCVPTAGSTADLGTTVQNIINVALGVVGIIAVVMLIIGGISYSTSAGDSKKVETAKNTILYGIVGLVIALLAAAIVNFVLDGVFSAA